MNLERLQQFPSVAANAESILVTDELLDKSVHAIGLKLGGTTFTRAHINAYTVKLDGKELLPSITGARLQAQNDYNGLDNDAAYMWYFFGDPTAQTIKGQHLGDLDLSIYRKPLEIRCNIGAATAPTLEALALTSVPKLAMGISYSEKDAMQIGVMKRSTLTPSAAVSRKTYGLSLGSLPGARIRKVNYHHSNLTSVELRKQGLNKIDDLTIAEISAVVKNYARVPQSGLYVVDHTFDGNQGEAETTVDRNGRPWSLEYMLSTSGSDTIEAYAELHAAWPQL